jgi:hypothetical protein
LSAVLVATIVIGIVVAQRVTELPAANLDYSVAIADGAAGHVQRADRGHRTPLPR